MSINRCRVCGNYFFKKPLFQYKNMPKAAQFLPDIKSLSKDKGVDLKIYQCSGCGLAQLSNEPVFYYQDVIRASAFSEEMKRYRQKQFSDFVTEFFLQGKKVIEIGCGQGEFLSIIGQYNVDAYGLEHSAESVGHCLQRGLKVSEGFIENKNYKLVNGPFDAFFILNFLEHLPDPNSILNGIHNNLIDGAVGLVEVPNFDMILRNKLFSEFINDHLFYFTQETLKTTLTLNGFEIINCAEKWHDYIISVVVRKRKKIDASDFYQRQIEIENEIKRYVNQFEKGKVAIWGAGHQALTVISLFNLAGKIKYVIDSALFKQGKYTPATHIPIVSPDELSTNPVNAVIIMAAGYSDEVAEIIQEKYGRQVKIAILRENKLEII